MVTVEMGAADPVAGEVVVGDSVASLEVVSEVGAAVVVAGEVIAL